jgi:hypothetical protein
VRRSGTCPSSCSSTTEWMIRPRCIHRSGRRVRQQFFATLGVSFARKALVFVLMSTGRLAVVPHVGRRRRRSAPVRGLGLRPLPSLNTACFDLEPAGPPYHALAHAPEHALWSRRGSLGRRVECAPEQHAAFLRPIRASGSARRREQQRESGRGGRSLRPLALGGSSRARTLTEASAWADR